MDETNKTQFNDTTSVEEEVEESKEEGKEEKESELMKMKKNLVLLIEDQSDNTRGISIAAMVLGKYLM